MHVEFVGALANLVQVVMEFRTVVKNLIFAGSAILPLLSAIFVLNFPVARRVQHWMLAVSVFLLLTREA
jgi:hypothetical protein